MEQTGVEAREDRGLWKGIFSNPRNDPGLDRKILFGIFVFALLIRIPLLIYPEVIHNDGTAYVRHAQEILSGDWSVRKSHPLYPLLIAAAHFITPTVEVAGILVSVLLGALVVFPVFGLGKEMSGTKAGTIAALFASVHPFLYMASGSVLTESTFHLLFAANVLYGWRAFDRGRWTDIVAFGLFTSLTYLTRPEAMAFLLVFGIWVLCIGPSHGSRPWTQRVGILLLGTFSFLIFSSFYLIQLRRETGRWQISKKVTVSAGSMSEGETAPSIDEIRVRKEIRISSFLKEPGTVLRKVASGFLHSLYLFQQVFTPPLTFFLILAFVLRKAEPFSQRITYYVLSYLLLFFGFIHPFFWVTRRYTSHVISICLPWAAIGFVEAAGWIRRRWEGSRWQERLPALMMGVVLVLLFLQGRVIHTRDHRVIQREVGAWMRIHLPKDVAIMSSLPQEAFYAERPWVRLPGGNYEKILEAARSRRVRYLVIDEMVDSETPDFWKKVSPEDLTPVKDWRRKAQRTVVYEVVYPEGKTSH